MIKTLRQQPAEEFAELTSAQLASVNGGNSLVGVVPDEFAGVIRWTNMSEYFEALDKLQELADRAVVISSLKPE